MIYTHPTLSEIKNRLCVKRSNINETIDAHERLMEMAAFITMPKEIIIKSIMNTKLK